MFGRLTIAATMLAAIVCVALVSLAGYIRSSTARLNDAFESVRIADRVQLDLLLHGQARSPLVRGDLSAALRKWLAFLEQADGDLDVLRARADLAAYLDATEAGFSTERLEPLRASAFGALSSLAAASMRDARRTQASIERWDGVATFSGVGLGLFALLFGGWMVWWTQSRAFRPLLGLVEAMRRLGAGEVDARAQETGAAELREIARGFNEMADALQEQRAVHLGSLGGIAHDLRNPLGTLHMALGQLDHERPLPPEAQVRRIVEIADRQIGRLTRMIDDVMDVARLESGQIELRVEVVDATALVREAIESFQSLVPRPRIEASLPTEGLHLPCDPMRFLQVVTNLIANAIKYSPAGEPVKVRLRRVGQTAELEVVDHGIGIEPADRERLFAPFVRVGPQREQIRGVGLGLFVIKRIVEAHDGRIEVDSEIGRGSRFRVFLPAESGSEAPQGEPHTPLLRAEPSLA